MTQRPKFANHCLWFLLLKNPTRSRFPGHNPRETWFSGSGMERVSPEGFFKGRGRVRAFPKKVPMEQQEYVEIH